MLVDAETARKLREMDGGVLVEALEALDDDMCAGPTFSGRIQMAADEAHSSFISQDARLRPSWASLVTQITPSTPPLW